MTSFMSVLWLTWVVFRLKRLESERIDLAAEKRKLENTLKQIDDSKRKYLEEMKNQTIVSKYNTPLT